MPENDKIQPDDASEERAGSDDRNAGYRNMKWYFYPLYGAYRFLSAFGDHFRGEAKDSYDFYAEFFSGLPIFFSYLGRQRKKRKAQSESKKRKKNLIRQEKKHYANERKKENREDKKLEKKILKRQKRDQRRRERTERRSKFARVLPYLLILSVIVCELAAAGGYGVLYLVDKIGSLEKSVTMNVYFEKSDQRKITIPAKCAYVDNDTALRFNMTFLAKQFDIRTYGGSESVIYAMSGGQKLQVYAGSNTVVINGRRLGLSQTVLFDGTNVYIPLELLQNYTAGLVISYDRSSRLLTLTWDKNIKNYYTDEQSENRLIFLPKGESPADQPMLV